jgi:hypothetical protein
MRGPHVGSPCGVPMWGPHVGSPGGVPMCGVPMWWGPLVVGCPCGGVPMWRPHVGCPCGVPMWGAPVGPPPGMPMWGPHVGSPSMWGPHVGSPPGAPCGVPMYVGSPCGGPMWGPQPCGVPMLGPHVGYPRGALPHVVPSCGCHSLHSRTSHATKHRETSRGCKGGAEKISPNRGGAPKRLAFPFESMLDSMEDNYHRLRSKVIHSEEGQ